MPEQHHDNGDEPVLIFDGPGTLQLEEGGKVYEPGDRMPHSFAHARRVHLQMTGLRFTTRHAEPVVMPDGKPAEVAAAETIDPPPGAPAVVAAIEDDVDAVEVRAVQQPKADQPKDEPAPRAPKAGSK